MNIWALIISDCLLLVILTDCVIQHLKMNFSLGLIKIILF